jgi:hypothetical protein
MRPKLIPKAGDLLQIRETNASLIAYYRDRYQIPAGSKFLLEKILPEYAVINLFGTKIEIPRTKFQGDCAWGGIQIVTD